MTTYHGAGSPSKTHRASRPPQRQLKGKTGHAEKWLVYLYRQVRHARWEGGADIRGQGQEPLGEEVTWTPRPTFSDPLGSRQQPQTERQRWGGSQVGAHSPLWGWALHPRGCSEPLVDCLLLPRWPHTGRACPQPCTPQSKLEKQSRFRAGLGFHERHFQRPGRYRGALLG